MTTLTWSARQAAEGVAGSLNSAAALNTHRPKRAAEVRASILDGLDEDARQLVLELAGAIQAEATS